MMNFAVDESNTIRSLAHDLFLDFISQWKASGIILTKDANCHHGSSIPSSGLCDTIIDSLMELAFTSRVQINKLECYDCDNVTNLPSISGESRTQWFVPVGELIMIIYLHAFPLNRPDLSLSENSNNVVEDILQETFNVSTQRLSRHIIIGKT